MGLLQRFQEHWQQAQFAAIGDTVLLAVSGGPDSMAMAGLFLDAKIPFAVAHCNFGLRGKAADEDEYLVLDWCLEHRIICHARCFNTRKKAAEEKLSIQEAARNLRYEYLHALCQEYNYARIATAHHREDNAETMLMRIFSGSGVSGLQGIPVRNGIIIRPLLFASRKSLHVYAADRQIPFRIDASNNSDAYQRNRIRRHVLPAIQKEFPDAVEKLNALAHKVQDVAWLYDGAVATQLQEVAVQQEKQLVFSVEKLKEHPARQTLLLEWLKPYGFRPAQIPDVLQLLHAGSGKRVSSASYSLLRDRHQLLLFPREQSQDAAENYKIGQWPGMVETSDALFDFKVTAPPATFQSGPNIAWLDLDKIKAPLCLRRWQQGDEFCPLGMQGKTKKLSDFFVDQKVSITGKERIWILESNKRIAWVAGMRLDDRFKISAATTQVLQVTMTPKTD